MTAGFYIAGAVAVIASLMTITGKNAVHSLLYLVVSLLAVAVVFFTLGAPFVGALEIIVYAGAIMVLFIFVVMMLNLGQKSIDEEKALLPSGSWWGPGLLVIVLGATVMYVIRGNPIETLPGRAVAPREVALALFGPYAVAVELASMLLLAGLIGAWHLGRQQKARAKGKR